jgi:adenosylmethionine-8-amino-7-oxononanoate aminotransferase
MELTQWSPGEPRKQVVRTNGYWIEYSNGERHLDVLSGNSAFMLGYNDQDILDAIRANPVHYLRGTTGESAQVNDELVELICQEGNWASVAWAVSGSDAVEAAVAMNDNYWAYQNKKKTKILSFFPGYHGTTMLAKHLRGEYSYLNRSVTVLAPNWKHYSDQESAEAKCLERIRKKLEANPDIGCVILETMPWFGHLTPYTVNWWKSIRQLCDEFDVLMINDDVALCWGKLGHLFGYQAYGVQPDIAVIGKALTGGYSPLGAAVCNQRVHDVLKTRTWLHGHTWAPNMWGVSAALVATKKIQQLMHRADNIQLRLRAIGDELELNYRGQGVAICYDFSYNVTWAEQSAVGLANNIEEHNAIKVFAPLIADDEFFNTLRTGLQKLLKKS